MPVRSPPWPFTAATIENSPDDWGGVYVLCERHEAYPRCNEKR